MRHLLGLSILAIALGAAAFSVVGEARPASARLALPAGFEGTVVVNGQELPGFAILETRASDGTWCNSAFIYPVPYPVPQYSAYEIAIPQDNGHGCVFSDGDPVEFWLNGMKATQEPLFQSGVTQTVNLTFYSRVFQCTPALCPVSMTPVFILPSQSR